MFRFLSCFPKKQNHTTNIAFLLVRRFLNPSVFFLRFALLNPPGWGGGSLPRRAHAYAPRRLHS